MSECNHNHLTRLDGPMHPSGKDYRCEECGQQLKAEVIVIAQFGTQEGEMSEPLNYDLLARNVCSELAMPPNAEVLTILKTAFENVWQEAKRGDTVEPEPAAPGEVPLRPS
jgi:hypothetical protein